MRVGGKAVNDRTQAIFLFRLLSIFILIFPG
jgi:hypothetical protein